MDTRSKQKDNQTTEENPELYPHSTLVDTSLYLMKIIDEKDGTSWNGLKRKCGIFPWNKNNKAEKGWAKPSHCFSLTGLPEEYIEEFSAELGLSSPVANVQTKSKSGRKSVPTATVTLPDSDGNDAEAVIDLSVSDTEDVNEQAPVHKNGAELCCSIEEDSRETTISNGMKNAQKLSCFTDEDIGEDSQPPGPVSDEKEVDNNSVDVIEKSKIGRKSIEIAGVNAETSPKSVVDVEGIRVKENDNAAFIGESNNIFEGKKQGQKRKLGREDIEFIDNDNDNGHEVIKSLEIWNSRYVGSSKEIADVGEVNIDGNHEEMNDNETTETVVNPTSRREENIIDLDKDVSQGIVMTTRQGDTYKFKCDFCPAVSAYEKGILKHLEEAMHYSASLVSVDGTGIPENTVWQCMLTHEPARFKTVIATCPYRKCCQIFRHIYMCATHYNLFHNPEEGPVYALSDVIGEERITVCDIFEQCKVCSAKFGRKNIISHMKKENHLPYTDSVDGNVKTIFLCTHCEQVSPKFFKILNHVHMNKLNKGIDAEIRVFHISHKRVTKSVLPYKPTTEIDLAIVNSEINNLIELKKTANGKSTQRMIHVKLQEMKRLKENPKGSADHQFYVQPDRRKTMKFDQLEKKDRDYANFLARLENSS